MHYYPPTLPIDRRVGFVFKSPRVFNKISGFEFRYFVSPYTLGEGLQRTEKNWKVLQNTTSTESSIVMLSYTAAAVRYFAFVSLAIKRAYAEQKTTMPVSRLILIEFVGWTVGGG